ncbi:MAG: hypothetical protein WDN66_02400 [Candidatus Saccharibacteria bacterium]
MFDAKINDAGSETSQTDIEDTCEDGINDICEDNIDVLEQDDINIEDAAQLFEGNLHPPEYYRRAIKEFNEAAFDNEDYSPGSTVLLDGIEELWNQYIAGSCFRCLVHADKTQVLRLHKSQSPGSLRVYLALVPSLLLRLATEPENQQGWKEEEGDDKEQLPRDVLEDVLASL